MPTVWFALRKSLQCKPEASEVHDPKARKQQLGSILTSRRPARSGCSRSISNLKDVIHGSKRHQLEERPPSCSPRSIGSSELLNPLTHEVVLSESTCELKIAGFGGGSCHESDTGLDSTYVATLKPGTPGQGSHHNPSRRSPGLLGEREGHGFWGSSLSNAVFGNDNGNINRNCNAGGDSLRASSVRRASHDDGSSAAATCHKCGEQFGKLEALEAHHLSKHAVTELVEGDSSRKIVEIICKTSWLKADNNCGRIERILKVHNMQKTLARFEEYRETVKVRASKLPKKHPRCLADGNELLRFHGTTVACSLGMNGSSGLCISDKCSVCKIIRHGFSMNKQIKGGIGVFTTSTSSRAIESIEISEGGPSIRKALLVCRVIAGRVHKPLENFQEFTGQSGFDSLAGKVGVYANIEELYLLNTRALLPCFVVICKP